VHFGGGRLVPRPDHDLVDVDVGGLGHGPADRLGDVLGAQRSHVRVDLRGRLLVATEADYGELGLDHAGRDLGDPDRLPEQLQAQRAQDSPLSVLGGGVPGAAAVDLGGGDAGDGDDVAVTRLDQARQQGPGHPHRPQYVRLVHRPPQFLVGLAHWCEPERAAGVVDEHVAGGDLRREPGDRLRLGHVQLDCPPADLSRQLLQPLEPAGAEDNPVAAAGQGPGGGGADAA
jgi:hypothetical protein